jgi:hypothetical protein
MKKIIFIVAFFAFPALAHAQIGGSLAPSQPVMNPPIERAENYIPVTASNPGNFEPSVVMNWDDAIDLANRLQRNDESLGLVAREAREQKAREVQKAHVLSNDDLKRATASNGGPSKPKR